MIGGDFNGRDPEPAIGDFPDVCVIATQPTRAQRVLDLIVSNIDQTHMTASVIEPLETEDGRQSDHNAVLVEAEISNYDRFTKKKITYRPQSHEGNVRFGKWIAEQSWLEVHEERSGN